ncbi:ammonium transporter [Nocardioides sp. IC4_145]|nr:ammonium transporter [Nocardioides sp. IC4_145]
MDTGTTAFILCCIIGLTLMIPGLALFYGGMVSVKSSLNMMLMTFGAVGVVGVLWVLFGYSMVFGDSVGGAGIVGDPTEWAGLTDAVAEADATMPTALFAVFQALFAAITVALISGAVADRMKFGAWMGFAGAWAVLVYFPVAHWVFAFDGDDIVGGWIVNKLEAVDFAGGTAVHINAGAAALALAIVLGKRATFGQAARPHNIPLTLLGAGLLWAGWYAFNGGSALAASKGAALVMLTTFVATAAAMLAWMLVEKQRDGHVTGVGAASGAIAGLVAITPSCGAVTPMGALAVGAVAGAVCPLALGLKERFGYDDTLDVVGVHLVGGLIGTVMVGLLASESMPSGRDGLLYGGGLGLLGVQVVAAVAVLLYSAVVSGLIALAIKSLMGLRVSPEEEEGGLDSAFHRDRAYDLV